MSEYPLPADWPTELAALIERLGSTQDASSSIDETLVDMNLSTDAREQLRAALLLLAGELDQSHEISQQDHSRMGSLLHGIMHRREGDYGNAKYWFARCGAGYAVDTVNAYAKATGIAEAVQEYDPSTLTDRRARNRHELPQERIELLAAIHRILNSSS